LSGCDPSDSPRRVPDAEPGAAGLSEGVSEPPDIPTGTPILTEVLSVSDAVELEAGWALLDSRARRIHLLDPEGSLIRSVGRRGQGPGELGHPAALILDADGFGVVDTPGSRVDRFRGDGTFIETRRISPKSCRGGGVVIAASGSPYPSDSIHIAFRCANPATGEVRLVVERIGPEGTGREVGSRFLFDLSSGAGSVFAFPLFAAEEGRVVMGVSTDPCLSILGGDATESTRCHPDPIAVALPEAERRAFDSLSAELEARLPGSRVPTPTHLPLFEAVFVTPSGLVVRRILGTDRRRLELIESDGTGVAPLGIPDHEMSWVGPRSVIATWEVETGTAMRIYSLSALVGPAAAPGAGGAPE